MKTRLYIGGVNVDLFDDVPITVNYSVTDIKDPASRTVSYTKTIELPNTPNNAQIFKQLFVVNKDNTINSFDPNLRVVAFVQNGTSTLIEGYFQLTNIVKLGNDVKYEGVIYSEGKNVFSQMGDSFLVGNADSSKDVDLETGTTQVLYQYTATEYGKTVANNFVSSSREGGLFMIDSGTNTTSSSYPYYSVPYTNLRMGVKFKHIWDRIFTKYGATYSSTFLNSTFFKSMVYMDMHKTANLSISQYNNIIASVNRTSNTGYLSGGYIVVFDNDLQDIGNRYNNTTGVYTVNSNRDFTISTNLIVQSRITLNTGATFSAGDVDIDVVVRVRKNGVPLPASNAIKQYINVPAGTYPAGYTFDYVIGDLNGYTIPFEITWDAQIGDTFDVTVETSGAPAVFTSSVRVLTDSICLIKPTNNSLGAGEIYNKNSVPANQHKQKDFIGDILKMFNLYVLFDGVNYIIEPRDTFYQLGFVRDWTNKIDRSQAIEIVPVGQLNWKQITFKGAADKDYYSDKYTTDYAEVYGQQDVFNNNEFISEVKTVDLKFAPPLSVSEQFNYPKLQHMYKLNNGVAEAIDGMPRYGYWAGWVEEGIVSNEITGITAPQTYNGYLFVGEFNNPTTPTLSVLFGPPKAIYYQTAGILAITNNDLYNTYYNNELNNQISANAKLIRCYVLITPDEINNLKLYDTVIVDGVQCLISKISDYDTNNLQSTQLELIQYVQ